MSKHKHKMARFKPDGEPANRYAKRELGELVESFGEIGATFKKTYRRESVFYALVLIGESKRYLPLDMLSFKTVQEIAEHAGKTLIDSKLEKVLDWIYADLARRSNICAS